MIRYNEEKKANEICIIEVFSSLNGEGPLAGYPTVFIRTMGCNLRCKYNTVMNDKPDSILNGFCDTPECFSEKHFKETYPDRELQWYTAQELYDKVCDMEQHFLYKSICLTGGEPLVEANKEFMLKELLPLFLGEGDESFDVSIETNGSIDYRPYKQKFGKPTVYPDGHRKGLSLITDWKFPASGMTDKMVKSNLSVLTETDVIKIVLSDEQQDWDYLEQFLNTLGDMSRVHYMPVVYLSPMFQFSSMERIWNYITDKAINGNSLVPIRMQVQLHKIVFMDDPNKKGV